MIESFAKELQDVMNLLPAYVTVSLHVTGAGDGPGSEADKDSDNIRDMKIKYCRPNISQIIKEESMSRHNKLAVAG